MPDNSIEELRLLYDGLDWRSGGETWAARWGGTWAQWRWVIAPRLTGLLEGNRAIEIGAGFGRWSALLAGEFKHLDVTEISPVCCSALTERFGEAPSVSVQLTDGLGLPFAKRSSVDFVFSLFSLVHADHTIMTNIVKEISRVLKPDGAAFIHHSNAGVLAGRDPEIDTRLRLYRSLGMSANDMNAVAASAGMHCATQEIFGWDNDRVLGDCFSVLRPGLGPKTPPPPLVNRRFCADAPIIKAKWERESDESA